MRVVRLDDAGEKYIVVTHENITPIKESEEALRKREKQLTSKAKKLEEANVALEALRSGRLTGAAVLIP